MWAYGLLLCMFMVVREQLFGEHATRDVRIFLAAYGGYIMVPIAVMVRVASAPVFRRQAKNKTD